MLAWMSVEEQECVIYSPSVYPAFGDDTLNRAAVEGLLSKGSHVVLLHVIIFFLQRGEAVGDNRRSRTTQYSKGERKVIWVS
jgi:hypothetical protein